MASPDTAEEAFKRASEKRAARLAAEAAASAPVEAEPAPTPKPKPAPVAKAPTTPPKSAPAARAAAPPPVVKAPAPEASKPVSKAPPVRKTQSLDEKFAEQERAYDTSPEGVARRANRALGDVSAQERRDAALDAENAKNPFIVAATKIPGFAAGLRLAGEEPTPEAVAREMRLQVQGLGEAGTAIGGMGQQAGNAARIIAGDKLLALSNDPTVVGGAAVTGTLNPARAAVKKEIADALADYETARAASDKKAAQKRAQATPTAPPGDMEAARALIEKLRDETKVTKGKGPSLSKQYVDRRTIQLENQWGVEKEKDPAKVAAAHTRAQDQALVELARANTEGYAIPIGRDVLFNSDSLWTSILPSRGLSASGKVGRGESLPGWFFNVVMGAPDYGVTTLAQALEQDKFPSVEDLARNVGDRRDIITYAIEQDPKLQADIASGDPRRVTHAIVSLSPLAVLELATPDALTFIKLAKAPGSALKAVRVAQEASRLMRVEKDLGAVLALRRAVFNVEKAAEDAVTAAKVAKKTAADTKTFAAAAKKVEAATPKAEPAPTSTRWRSKDYDFPVDVLEEPPQVQDGRSWQKVRTPDGNISYVPVDELVTEGAKPPAPRPLTGVPEAVVVRIQDDIAARLSVDPDVQAFLNESGAAGSPLSPETVDGVIENASEAAERGRAKYPAAFSDADRLAREDFIKQARGEQLDPTVVVDVGADAKRKAEIAAEEAKLAKDAELADELRRAPDERADYDAAVAEHAAEVKRRREAAKEAERALRDAEDVATRTTRDTEKAQAWVHPEAEQFADGTHPLLQKLRKAGDEAQEVLGDEPPFESPKWLERQRIAIEREQAALDALEDGRRPTKVAKYTPSDALQKQRAHLAKEQQALDAAKAADAAKADDAARARRQAIFDKRKQSLDKQEQAERAKQLAEAPLVPLTPAQEAARQKKQKALDLRKWAYLHDREVLEAQHVARGGERAQARENALARVRAAREDARRGLERVQDETDRAQEATAFLEREQEQTASAAARAAEQYGGARAAKEAAPARPARPEGRAPNPERLAAVEARIAEREARIAGKQKAPMRELFAARGFEDLVAEIAQINAGIDVARRFTPQSLRWRLKRLGMSLVDDVMSWIHPSRELEMRSIAKSLWRPVVESFEGELSRINERLAEALADVEVSTPDAYTLLARRNERGTLDAPWNPIARSVAEDYVFPFIESVRGGGVDGAYLGAVATAYLQDPSLLDANKLKLLTDVVVQWARRGDGDLDVLRAALLDVSEKTKSPLRKRQIGDVNLANAMGSQGAAHRMLVEADARGLTRSAADARAANTHLDNLNGTGQVGGRAEASRGRQVMANLLVPESYRRPLGAGSDIEDVSKPLVPARTDQARLGRKPKAVKQEEALREAAGTSLAAPEPVRPLVKKKLDTPHGFYHFTSPMVMQGIAREGLQPSKGGNGQWTRLMIAEEEDSLRRWRQRRAKEVAAGDVTAERLQEIDDYIAKGEADLAAYRDGTLRDDNDVRSEGVVMLDDLAGYDWLDEFQSAYRKTGRKDTPVPLRVKDRPATLKVGDRFYEYHVKDPIPPSEIQFFEPGRGWRPITEWRPEMAALYKQGTDAAKEIEETFEAGTLASKGRKEGELTYKAAGAHFMEAEVPGPMTQRRDFTTRGDRTNPAEVAYYDKAAKQAEKLLDDTYFTYAPEPEPASAPPGVTAYHGGNVQGDFDVAKTSPDGKYGRGLYFTTSKEHAASYGPVNEVRVNLQRPFDLGAQVSAEEASKLLGKPTTRPMSGKDLWSRLGSTRTKEEARQVLEAAGFDGIRSPGNEDAGEWFIAFDAKSVSKGDDAVASPPITEVGSAAVAEAASEATRREAAVQSMTEVLTNTEEVLEDNVFVPRAVRDALARQVDAVIATARIDDDAGTLIQRNFWKQSVVLGVYTSKPNQTAMDFMSDVWATNQRLGPVEAALVAGRSVAAQFLATWGAAQAAQLVDKMLGQKPGKAARDFVAKLSMTPQIDAIFNRSADVRMGPGGKYTALEVHDIWRAGKVFESFSAGQLTRTTAEAAYLVFGDTPFGKAKAAYFANQRALQEMANLSASRRRLAIAYGLLEVGHTPESAAKVAVKIAGDFSGELHPIERGWVSTVFPFWAYRRFNARRTVTALTNPFWLTRGLKAQEGGAAMASWYLDDSDEYGFHTESMYTEPDAEALDALRTQVHTEHPEWDIASAEAEAMVQERSVDLPRAIVRYERLVKKLRAMPYDAAKKEFNENDPEWRWLAMYHADDPVRGMLPEYAQDRYAVFVQENRNQAVDSWYRKGVGRTERDPNEQRYWLLPNDPHIDGLAELMAVAAIGSVAVGAMAQDDVDFAKYNRTELLNGVFRDPLLSVAGFVGAGDFTPAERQYGKVVPDWAGEILFRRGLAVLDTEQDRGEDVLDAPETKRGAKYVIPPTVINAASLLPLVAPALLGSIELAIAGARLTGDPGKAGPRDALDRRAAVVEGLFGQKLQTTTPVTQGIFARKEADRRVQGWVEDIGPQQALDPSEETLQVRSIRGSLGSPTFQQEVRLAKAKMAGNQTLTSQDFGALRAYLVSTGLSEEQARMLSNTEVVARINATR